MALTLRGGAIKPIPMTWSRLRRKEGLTRGERGCMIGMGDPVFDMDMESLAMLHWPQSSAPSATIAGWHT